MTELSEVMTRFRGAFHRRFASWDGECEHGLDVETLGLSAEQTAILREHLASRQQTVSEFLGDMLMDIGLGRATGKEYPPPAAAHARLQEQDR